MRARLGRHAAERGRRCASPTPTTAPLPPGDIGEILVRGEPRDEGLLAQPRGDGRRRCAAAGCTPATSAPSTRDGYLTLKDRSKDLIISGGSNIYPREVEEVLLRHDGVAECSVVGAPDPEWGERVVAFVVRAARHGADAEALDRLCLDNIARFKRPKEYRFVDRTAQEQLRQDPQDRAARTGGSSGLRPRRRRISTMRWRRS